MQHFRSSEEPYFLSISSSFSNEPIHINAPHTHVILILYKIKINVKIKLVSCYAETVDYSTSTDGLMRFPRMVIALLIFFKIDILSLGKGSCWCKTLENEHKNKRLELALLVPKLDLKPTLIYNLGGL